jgi:hypothetical protein
MGLILASGTDVPHGTDPGSRAAKRSRAEQLGKRLLCRAGFSGDPDRNQINGKEHPCGAMRCEWAVLVGLACLGGPVTGRVTQSPVFVAAAACDDLRGPSLAVR